MLQFNAVYPYSNLISCLCTIQLLLIITLIMRKRIIIFINVIRLFEYGSLCFKIIQLIIGTEIKHIFSK